MPVGTEIIRTLGQARKQRAFLDRELLRRLAEIAARRHLDAPGAAAEIDGIEIELENLRLAERLLDPRRHDHLADLALVGQVFAHQQVLDDLLGDGRAALRAPRGGEIADEGADQAALVDSLVLIEAFVLGREKGLLHVLRDVGEWNPHAPLVLLEHLRKALALAVEHDARSRKLDALEFGVIGQIGGRLVVEVDDVAEIHGRHRDFLVLAELPVGGLQIGKIDAVKNLALAGDRLRVVHGGCDQLLEVDVLDVEGLAHMRAARVQELSDLLLVSHAIELRLHRVRRGGYLTKCKSRGEDFDQGRFHHRPEAAATAWLGALNFVNRPSLRPYKAGKCGYWATQLRAITCGGSCAAARIMLTYPPNIELPTSALGGWRWLLLLQRAAFGGLCWLILLRPVPRASAALHSRRRLWTPLLLTLS